MANGSITRQTQKNRLKQQIVPEPPEQGTGRRRLRLPLRLLLPALLIVLLLGTGVFWYLTNRHYEAFTITKETEPGTESGRAETFRSYLKFADGILRYSRDGASYINGDGKTIWERSYQMQNPVAEVNGDYAVIIDQGAQSIYIFNSKANTGVASAIYPVSRAAVSQSGVVYAVLKDEKADYITAFKPDGSGIDLSIKSVMTGDGYPLDIAVSADGTELLTSYVAIENSQVVQKVVFRNFDEVGKTADARRVVGGFTEEFDGHMVGRVHFSGNEYSQAFYDGGIAFFSTKVLTSPELLNQVDFEEEINSIAYSDQYVAAVLNTNTGEKPYKLVIFKANGTKLAETELDFPYTAFALEKDRVLLYNESACRIYNLRGKEIAAVEFPFETAAMTAGKLPGEYLLCGDGRLAKVRLR